MQPITIQFAVRVGLFLYVAYSVSSEKTLAKWGKGNCKSFRTASVGFVPMST